MERFDRLTLKAVRERQAVILHAMRMHPDRISVLVLLVSLSLAGCSKEKSAKSAPSPIQPAKSVAVNDSNPADSTPIQQTLTTVESSITGGSYDEAAASLLKMRANQTKFSQPDAAAYRRALEDAYSRALEAASKGDARARAAVQMIRAAGPH